MGQLVGEDAHDPLAGAQVERVHGFVHQYPAGRVQQQAREGNGLLFILIQLMIPTADLVQQGCETDEPQSFQRAGILLLREPIHG